VFVGKCKIRVKRECLSATGTTESNQCTESSFDPHLGDDQKAAIPGCTVDTEAGYAGLFYPFPLFADML
jgi:hypothetical protein